jgi:hypothetical protein
MQDIILEKTLDDMQKPNISSKVLLEVLSKIKTPKKLESMAVRRRLYEDCGKEAFIDPYNLKYPIIDVTKVAAVENCTPCCNLLAKAFFELKSQEGNPGVADMISEVKSLLRDNSCRSKISVHLEGMEELMDIEAILYYFD